MGRTFELGNVVRIRATGELGLITGTRDIEIGRKFRLMPWPETRYRVLVRGQVISGVRPDELEFVQDRMNND